MRMESGPDSAYTRTWSPSGEIEYAKLADGTRLRYPKAGASPAALILLHTVRTQLDHFQLVVPKISRAFTVYAVDMPGMGWSDIRPGASYAEPALRRAIVEFVTTLNLNDLTLARSRAAARGGCQKLGPRREKSHDSAADIPRDRVCAPHGSQNSVHTSWISLICSQN
jgi:hypothetical protein